MDAPSYINMILNLILLFVVSFVQNMAFIWSSRSRNSGDPNYHRLAAICSNGVWFITQIFLVNTVWKSLFSTEQIDWLSLILGAVVYIAGTTEGSVYMMKILLKKESGKRQVGSK